MDEALGLIGEAYEALASDCDRIYSTVKFDIRSGKGGRLEGKVKSVEAKLGKKLQT
jgi:uncharacterized protein YqgV (UPF0045/DUF77 family)